MKDQNKQKIDLVAVEITEALLERAKVGKHTVFTLLRSYPEYLSAKLYKDSALHVYKNFYKLSKYLKKTYLALVAKGTDNLELLLSYKNLDMVIKFYAEEVRIAKDIIAEYWCYIRSGHFINTFLFNKYRADKDMVDFRTIKWTL